MIAEYTMKRNGKWYKAGDEVPEINTPASSGSRYTKTDINRMSVSDLRQIVMGTGVENADIMTGAEMKEYLINLFGL
jgi:hypothetical protein